MSSLYHPGITLVGGVIPAHVPGAYPDLDCCDRQRWSVTVDQTDGSEAVLLDGWTYTIQTRQARLRGTLSLRRSSPTRLFFYGYTVGEWFRVDVDAIIRADP